MLPPSRFSVRDAALEVCSAWISFSSRCGHARNYIGRWFSANFRGLRRYCPSRTQRNATVKGCGSAGWPIGASPHPLVVRGRLPGRRSARNTPSRRKSPSLIARFHRLDSAPSARLPDRFPSRLMTDVAFRRKRANSDSLSFLNSEESERSALWRNK